MIIKPRKISIIEEIIKKNRADNFELLKGVEEILISNRGYVFRMPPPGTPVIALMSGGLDTTVVIAVLMEEYGLKIYPLFFDRGFAQTGSVRRSVDKLSKFFNNKYPGLYNPVFELAVRMPPEELKKVVGGVKVVERVLDSAGHRMGVVLQPTWYAQYGMYYSQYLFQKYKVTVRDIFGAYLPANIVRYRYESLTAQRVAMLTLCTQHNDFSWQFSSIPMEKELGFYFEKEVLVGWGSEHGIPLEDTWTCWLGGRYQCGVCDNCMARRAAFRIAGVVDRTKYLNDLEPMVVKKIKRVLKKVRLIK